MTRRIRRAVSARLWYAHDAPGESEPESLTAPEAAGIYGEDPGFADVASDDVSIDANGPLAEAGRTLSEVTVDLDGACFGDPPSIGTLEVE